MTRPTEPDDLAFFRGMVVGLCFSGCIWIALACAWAAWGEW